MADDDSNGSGRKRSGDDSEGDVDDGLSDATLLQEFTTDTHDLAFNVIGAPLEVVEVTLVAPPVAEVASRQGGASLPRSAIARAMDGDIRVLRLQLSANGAAKVRCAAGQCQYPSLLSTREASGTGGGEGMVDGPPPVIGCSDGSCDGFCSADGVAACAANWTGRTSLRALRTPSAPVCGGSTLCASPADACARGWSICLSRGVTQSGHSSAAELVARLNASQCATGANGSFATAMSSARRFPCPAGPPGCDMGCNVDAYGSEPVCCGSDCHVPSCANGVWPTPGTLIKMGAGTPHRSCADMMGGWMAGVLCCKDAQ